MSQESNSSPPPSSGASDGGASSSLRTNVRIGLFALLGVLVIAIAYDYLYARPAVDKAYDKITALNNDMNVAAGAKVLLSDDVHEALGRKPTTVLKEDPFTIEVYQWRAGLPWRTYDYYVVYVGKKELAFSTHFKNERMPMENLAPPVEWKEGTDVVPPPGEIGVETGAGAGRGRPNNNSGTAAPTEQAPSDGGQAPQNGADTPPADTPPADAPPADTPPADTPPADTPPADTPPADTPPAGTPPAGTPPAGTPPAGTPPADTPPADAPPADTPVANP